MEFRVFPFNKARLKYKKFLIIQRDTKMKVLFLHLSDMRFAKSDKYIANRAKK